MDVETVTDRVTGCFKEIKRRPRSFNKLSLDSGPDFMAFLWPFDVPAAFAMIAEATTAIYVADKLFLRPAYFDIVRRAGWETVFSVDIVCGL